MLKIRPKTFFVGKNVIFLPSCHSTNDIASEMIQNSKFIDGTVIFTDLQTQGKGQRGNQWESAAGQNILMSLMVRTDFLRLDNQYDLSICTALSVVEALSEFISEGGLKIKWPNDIYFNEQKLGGILIENSLSGNKMDKSVVGIGININQRNFENARATSVSKILSLDINRETVIEKILEHFEKNILFLKNGKFENLKNKYLKHLLRFRISGIYKSNSELFEGIILDVARNGLLILKVNNQEKYYNIKEIEYIFEE